MKKFTTMSILQKYHQTSQEQKNKPLWKIQRKYSRWQFRLKSPESDDCSLNVMD